MVIGDIPRGITFQLPTGESTSLEALLTSDQTLLVFLRHLA